MTPIDQSIGLSIGATAAPSLRPKEKAMYNEGFGAAGQRWHGLRDHLTRASWARGSGTASPVEETL